MRAIPPVRTARPEELAQLPALESASDTLFFSLEIGPLPPPDSVEALRAARVVLVSGDPPLGFVRVDDVGGEAHLEQLAVHPDHGRRGIGRALVQAACRWAAAAGYTEITLATYRDVPWNGPFYATAGFVERGSVDDWCLARGRPLEQPVLARFGSRVIMRRPL